MNYQKHVEPEAALPFAVSFYLSAFAELEDALRWTLAMLRRHSDAPSAQQDAEPGSVTDDCMAVRQLLHWLPADRRPATSLIDETLRRCLPAQAFCERVIAGSGGPDGTAGNEFAQSPPHADELRREAREMISLAMKVLSLHALFRRA